MSKTTPLSIDALLGRYTSMLTSIEDRSIREFLEQGFFVRIYIFNDKLQRFEASRDESEKSGHLLIEYNRSEGSFAYPDKRY